MSLYQRLFSKVSVIILAIGMMVGSALISYFLVRTNDTAISRLQVDIDNKQTLIRDIWNNLGKQETRLDTVLLLSLLLKEDQETVAKIKTQYLKYLPNITSETSVIDMLKILEKETASRVDRINDLYVEQASLKVTLSDLQNKNRFYFDIAFFLQTLSLVLIILIKET